jgi:hypothetical protein
MITVQPEAPPDAAALLELSDKRDQWQRAVRRREVITCRVSLLAPDEQRKWWRYLGRCPVCGRPHLGRSPEPASVTGTRRLPCRHWVVIVVARTYGRTEGAA